MALHSVATPKTSSRRERDPYDPYERLVAKLDELQAIASLAKAAHARPAVTIQVLQPLWYFVGQLTVDIRQEADELRQEARR